MQPSSDQNPQVANSANDQGNSQTEHDELGFFDKAKNVSIILYSFYAVCVILVVLDFVVHRHIYLPFEKIPTFYAAYGFIACVILVVLAKLMRVALMKDENYYDARLDEVLNEPLATNVYNKTDASHNIDSSQDSNNDIPQDMDELGLSKASNPMPTNDQSNTMDELGLGISDKDENGKGAKQ